ncbi:MAG: glycosyltransferase family 4 protein [bacterium]|nr:glycosyltransferase family 4 protein [bacterium]
MRTLLFTLEYPPFRGGVANFCASLVKYWPEPDNIFVLHNNGGGLINDKLPCLKWLPAARRLRQEIKKYKIDHVLAGNILPLGAAALICAKFINIKYSVILHGMDLPYALRRKRKKWLAEKILRQAEKIFCGNSYTAEMVKKFLPVIEHGKIITVNPGVSHNIQYPISLASPDLAKPDNIQLKKKYNLENKIILLSVGRLVMRKGFDKVIEAMPKVLEKIPNLVYIILGDGGEFGNWKLKIENLKLEKFIYIIKQSDDEQRDLWYNISDIFIMPSRNINGDFEGFGIVYLEANLAGKPVIAGDSGGVRDAVIDGVNGLLVNPEDTNAIASAIIKLASDSELRQKLGKQGRERAIREFSWGKQIAVIARSVNDEAISRTRPLT